VASPPVDTSFPDDTGLQSLLFFDPYIAPP
jgi:hypothetical protein